MPQTFSSETDLPQRTNGDGTSAPATSTSDSGSVPADTYGTFHGDTPHKNVAVSEKDNGFGKGVTVKGIPDGVDTFESV
jgi:hypothetical protein